MKFNRNIFIFLIVLFIFFLVGCQPQVQEEVEQEKIEIIDEGLVLEEIEQEFDDNLDRALDELEKIESFT